MALDGQNLCFTEIQIEQHANSESIYEKLSFYESYKKSKFSVSLDDLELDSQSEPWFIDNITREEATRIFRLCLNDKSLNKSTGLFLVRRQDLNSYYLNVRVCDDNEQKIDSIDNNNKILDIQILIGYENSQRFISLEIDADRKFSKLIELVKYYQSTTTSNEINNRCNLKLSIGVDKNLIVYYEPWYLPNASAIESEHHLLQNQMDEGSFLIRKSSRESRQRYPTHLYTLVVLVLNNDSNDPDQTKNKDARKCLRYRITMRANKYKILSNEFDSLIEIVNYYRINPIHKSIHLAIQSNLDFRNHLLKIDNLLLMASNESSTSSSSTSTSTSTSSNQIGVNNNNLTEGILDLKQMEIS